MTYGSISMLLSKYLFCIIWRTAMSGKIEITVTCDPRKIHGVRNTQSDVLVFVLLETVEAQSRVPLLPTHHPADRKSTSVALRRA